MTCARRLRVAFAFGSGVLAAGAAQACEASWAEFAALGDYDATSAQASPVYLEVGFKDEEACARASVSLVPATDAPAAAYRSRSARLVGAGGRMLRLEANGDAPHGSHSGRSVGGARSFPVFRIAPHQFEPSGVYAESFSTFNRRKAARRLQSGASGFRRSGGLVPRDGNSSRNRLRILVERSGARAAARHRERKRQVSVSGHQLRDDDRQIRWRWAAHS